MLTVVLVFSTMLLPPEGGSYTAVLWSSLPDRGSQAAAPVSNSRRLPSNTLWLPPSGGSPLLQDEKSRGRKGDSVTLRGCLNGASLDATDADEPEVQTALIGGLTFQLKGDKKLLKALKDQHDGKVVTVRGTLRSDLLQSEGQSRTVGRTRITFGGAMPNPNSPHADTRRALPVVEVKSFDGTGETPCR